MTKITKTENLTKQEAIKALEEGHKITHAKWDSGVFIYMKDGKLYEESDLEISGFTGHETGWRIVQSQPAEHTPLPWNALQKHPVYNTETKTSSIQIYGKPDNRLICEAEGSTLEEAEANATLIVKAVNNHEKLVEALKLIAETCGVVNYSSHNQMREAIESAMSIAEELLATLKQVEQ